LSVLIAGSRIILHWSNALTASALYWMIPAAKLKILELQGTENTSANGACKLLSFRSATKLTEPLIKSNGAVFQADWFGGPSQRLCS
jgi:hypothetical protein